MSTLRTNAVESITGTATDFPNSLKIQGTLVPSGSAATEPTSRFPYVVGSVAELASVPDGLLVDGAAFRIAETGRAGDFTFDSSDLSAAVNGYDIIAPSGQTGSSGAFVKNSSIPYFGRLQAQGGEITSRYRIHRIAGTIRYYDGVGWDTLPNQNQGHVTIGVDSVTNDDTFIYVHFDTSDFGPNFEVCSFIVTPDETLANRNVFAGASTNVNRAAINLSRPGKEAYISYDGATWVSNNSAYVASDINFNETTGELSIRWFGHAFGAYPFAIARDSNYSVQMGSMDSGNEVFNVYFKDSNQNRILTPDTEMKLYIYEPMSFTNFPVNVAGPFIGNSNLWFEGCVVSWD